MSSLNNYSNQIFATAQHDIVEVFAWSAPIFSSLQVSKRNSLICDRREIRRNRTDGGTNETDIFLKWRYAEID